MVTLMLVLMALTLVFALLGLGTGLSALARGTMVAAWWPKIFGGLAFLLLGLLGFISLPYLSGSDKTVSLMLAFIITLLGSFLLRWGIRLKPRQS